VQFVATIFVSAWIVRRDVKRLRPRELARAWPEPSLWSAVVGFSPLCIPIHFLRTRRSLLGALLGVAWFAGALVAVNGIAWVVDAALEHTLDPPHETPNLPRRE
ncbi:MAG TPA: hypothetical protein VGQ57_16915, partial [Polyangiaceae bacterium]|nr:hypothetical protein [Polyangiaceae bacterium]